MKPTFDELVPATLAGISIAALIAAHWLQLPDSSATALVGVLAGSVTLYFVNKNKPTI